MALSSCEAELYAGSEAVKEGVLLKEMLLFIGMGEYHMELLLDTSRRGPCCTRKARVA